MKRPSGLEDGVWYVRRPAPLGKEVVFVFPIYTFTLSDVIVENGLHWFKKKKTKQ